ncbi:MAG: ACT domain-containing protein, partial [Kurthia sp.]
TKTSISAVNAKANRDKVATIHLTLQIKNIPHMMKVVDKIKSIQDIYSVQRVNN